jgi:hypothetical protein
MAACAIVIATAAAVTFAQPAGAATGWPAHPAAAAAREISGTREINGNRPAALAQDDDDQDTANQVQTKQVAQYVAVYKAMQKNHGLTVDQACAQQGMTVTQFRDIENKIERDDALTALVRKSLNPGDTSAADDDSDN